MISCRLHLLQLQVRRKKKRDIIRMILYAQLFSCLQLFLFLLILITLCPWFNKSVITWITKISFARQRNVTSYSSNTFENKGIRALYSIDTTQRECFWPKKDKNMFFFHWIWVINLQGSSLRRHRLSPRVTSYVSLTN